jgi:sulfite exporter TauE/SafE
MVSQLSEGFLLGIATGTTCLATCGPIYAPYLMQYDRGLKASLLALLEISGGRFITYLLVGAAAGLLSKSLPMEQKEWFTAASYILFSVFLILSAFRTHRKERCCATGKWYAFVDRPFVLGLVTGINFCPSFLLALTKAVDLSGPVAGMLLFSAFFVGTSIFLIPLSFFGVFGQQKLFRNLARISALGVGAWFIIQSVISIHGLIADSRQQPADMKNVINIMDSIPAFIVTDDTVNQNSLKAALSLHRKGSIALLPLLTPLPDSCYVFTYGLGADSLHSHMSPFRKKGRFVILLPNDFHVAANEINNQKLVAFLTNFSFKIDRDSGSVYKIPHGTFE